MTDTPQQLVQSLAVRHRARAAFRSLLDCGPIALPAVREGLRHPNPSVRYYCCKFLDHFLAQLGPSASAFQLSSGTSWATIGRRRAG